MREAVRSLSIASRLRLVIALGAVGLVLLAVQAYRVVASRMLAERETKLRAAVEHNTVDALIENWRKDATRFDGLVAPYRIYR